MTAPSESQEDLAPPRDAPRGSFLNDVAPALTWLVIVFVFGGIPNPGPPTPLEFPIDKVEHFGAFGVLQILVLRALRYELPGVLPRAMPWIAAAISIVAGAALEVYQLTVPNRSAELMDLVCDALGALLAAAVGVFLARRRRQLAAS